MSTAATIIYFGPDDSLRIPVLARAGFRVSGCESVAELSRLLQAAPDTEAVIFGEAPGEPANDAADEAREKSKALRILFQHPASASSEPKFDLVILPATPPERWLQQVAAAVLKVREPSGRILQGAGSAAIGRQSWADIARGLRSRRRGCSGLAASPQKDSAHPSISSRSVPDVLGIQPSTRED